MLIIVPIHRYRIYLFFKMKCQTLIECAILIIPSLRSHYSKTTTTFHINPNSFWTLFSIPVLLILPVQLLHTVPCSSTPTHTSFSIIFFAIVLLKHMLEIYYHMKLLFYVHKQHVTVFIWNTVLWLRSVFGYFCFWLAPK